MATTNKCKRHPKLEPLEDHRTGDVVCRGCGFVLDRLIDNGPEWRTFDDDHEEKSRVGAAEDSSLSSEYNLATRIAAPTGGTNDCGQFIVRRFKRRSIDNALIDAQRHINETASKLNLSDVVVQQAYRIYCRAYTHRKLKGNIILSDVKRAACIYLACKQERCSRTFEEICGATENSSKDIKIWAKRISKALNLNDEAAHADEFIDRFCHQLNTTKPVRIWAMKIARIAQEKISESPEAKISESPESMAGAIICKATERIESRRIPFEELQEVLGLNIKSVVSSKKFIDNLIKKKSFM